MKRAIALLALLAAACAGGAGNTKSDTVDVRLVELVGPMDAQPVGNFDLRYGVAVTNRGREPITIRRVELRQVGEGSYVLLPNNGPFTFTKTIAPGAEVGVDFWVHAYARTARGTFGGGEPVTVRAVVFFDSPSGPFRKMVHQFLGQLE